ncbi:MAG: RNA pseudouridine synthase [Vicinamibacterales bacterium]
MAVRVLRATPHEVVAVKPPGLPCEAPRDPDADSLVRRLDALGHPGLRLVHRLDAPASGLVLLAGTRAAAAHYAAEIQARRWHKWYVARVALPAGLAQRLVGPHKAFLKTEGRRARVVRSGGKPSFLDVVTVVGAAGAAGATDVLIRLHTGRFHQIRAMLASAGAPLVGDQAYGGPPGRLCLEHVVLGTWTAGEGTWTVWEAPAAPERAVWAPALTAAVSAAAATARTATPPRDPAP